MFKRSVCGLVLMMLTVGTAFAEPSDAQVEKDLRTHMEGITTVEFNKTNSGATKVDPITKQKEYYRSVSYVFPSAKEPGVDVEVMGEVKYVLRGAAWVWDSFANFGNRYHGIPDPTEADLRALYEVAGAKQFFQAGISTTVSPVTWTMAADPKFEWHKPTSVSLNIVAEMDKVVSATTVERHKQVFRIRLYRNTMKDPWTTRCANMCVASSLVGPPEVLETRTVESTMKLKTLTVLIDEGVTR